MDQAQRLPSSRFRWKTNCTSLDVEPQCFLATGNVPVGIHRSPPTVLPVAYMKDFLPLTLPATLGSDVSGTVEEVGPGAARLKRGDKVYASLGLEGGGYAEYAVAKEAIVAEKPSTLDHVQAAAVPVAGLTAWQAYLPLVGDFMSFNEIVDTLNRQGHNFSFMQVPADVIATFFPGAAEIAAMFRYFEAHTYLGSESRDRIALANNIAGRQSTNFST
jgi:hypothetical protein